jgi:hypothetical protein
MAILLDGNWVSYGAAVGIGGTGVYPPWFGLGKHEVLVFVEKQGGILQNHQLDPGELNDHTTFNTKVC